MRIVSVAATGNGSGKTLLLEKILDAFPRRLVAVKFTTVYRDGVNCPRTEKTCACRSLHGRYTVVTDPRVLETPSTDTGRLAAAGAHSVLWCLAQPGAHAEAWEHLRRDLLPAGSSVVTEGNSVVPVLQPALLLVVMSPALPRERWKPDAWMLAERADHVVVNRHRCEPGDAERLASEVAARRAPGGGGAPSIEEISRPLASWEDRSILEDLARTLRPAPGGPA